MAYTGKQIAHSFTAGEDLSGDQYKPVFVNSDGTIYNDDNSGARHFLGILQDKPEPGVAGTVCLFGISKVSVSGSTTTGAAFTTGSTPYTVGLVLEGTGAAGVATVLINHSEVAE